MICYDWRAAMNSPLPSGHTNLLFCPACERPWWGYDSKPFFDVVFRPLQRLQVHEVAARLERSSLLMRWKGDDSMRWKSRYVSDLMYIIVFFHVVQFLQVCARVDLIWFDRGWTRESTRFIRKSHMIGGYVKEDLYIKLFPAGVWVSINQSHTNYFKEEDTNWGRTVVDRWPSWKARNNMDDYYYTYIGNYYYYSSPVTLILLMYHSSLVYYSR